MQPRTWLAVGVVAAVIVALAVPVVRHLRERPPEPPPPLHLAFEPPPGSGLGAGDDSLDAAISPDGSEVVFAATTDGVTQLWRRTLADGRTEALRGTDGAQFPAWKQTGRVVAFFSGGRLRQLSLPDRVATDLAAAPAPRGGGWLPDGSLLFAPDTRGPIRRMLDGRVTDATTLGPGDRAHLFPLAAGDGGVFTYIALRDDGRRRIRLVTASGERDLSDTSGHAQIAGGALVYARDGVLLAQPFDASSGTVTGRSTPIAPSIGVSPAGHAMLAVSTRLLLFADDVPRLRDLAWLDPSTSQRTRIAEPGDYWQVTISPDDRFAAVTAVDPLLRTLDVFVVTTSAGGDMRPVTRALAADSDPVWSPEGGTILFRSMQSGRPTLFTRRIDTVGAPDEPVRGSEPGDTPTDWRGPRLLVHTAGGGATGSDIWTIDRATGSREPVATDAFNETDARWSPDGAWIAYVSDDSGQPDIYAVRSTGAAERIRVSFAGGSKPRWSHDGRSILFLRGSSIVRADRVAGPATGFGPAVPVIDAPGLRDFTVAHRTGRIAVLVPAPASRAADVRAIVDWRSLVGP